MASEMEKETGLCRIEASIPTGLEIGAAEECKEVLGRAPESARGRLSFKLCSLDELEAVKFNAHLCIQFE